MYNFKNFNEFFQKLGELTKNSEYLSKINEDFGKFKDYDMNYLIINENLESLVKIKCILLDYDEELNIIIELLQNDEVNVKLSEYYLIIDYILQKFSNN